MDRRAARALKGGGGGPEPRLFVEPGFLFWWMSVVWLKRRGGPSAEKSVATADLPGLLGTAEKIFSRPASLSASGTHRRGVGGAQFPFRKCGSKGVRGAGGRGKKKIFGWHIGYLAGRGAGFSGPRWEGGLGTTARQNAFRGSVKRRLKVCAGRSRLGSRICYLQFRVVGGGDDWRPCQWKTTRDKHAKCGEVCWHNRVRGFRGVCGGWLKKPIPVATCFFNCRQPYHFDLHRGLSNSSFQPWAEANPSAVGGGREILAQGPGLGEYCFVLQSSRLPGLFRTGGDLLSFSTVFTGRAEKRWRIQRGDRSTI